MGLKLLKKYRDVRITGRADLARIKSLVRTEELSADEIRRHFFGITGMEAAEFFDLASEPATDDNLRRLLHASVVLANEIGQPEGEELTDKDNEVSLHLFGRILIYI